MAAVDVITEAFRFVQRTPELMRTGATDNEPYAMCGDFVGEASYHSVCNGAGVENVVFGGNLLAKIPLYRLDEFVRLFSPNYINIQGGRPLMTVSLEPSHMRSLVNAGVVTLCGVALTKALLPEGLAPMVGAVKDLTVCNCTVDLPPNFLTVFKDLDKLYVSDIRNLDLNGLVVRDLNLSTNDGKVVVRPSNIRGLGGLRHFTTDQAGLLLEGAPALRGVENLTMFIDENLADPGPDSRIADVCPGLRSLTVYVSYGVYSFKHGYRGTDVLRPRVFADLPSTCSVVKLHRSIDDAIWNGESAWLHAFLAQLSPEHVRELHVENVRAKHMPLIWALKHLQTVNVKGYGVADGWLKGLSPSVMDVSLYSVPYQRMSFTGAGLAKVPQVTSLHLGDVQCIPAENIPVMPTVTRVHLDHVAHSFDGPIAFSGDILAEKFPSLQRLDVSLALCKQITPEQFAKCPALAEVHIELFGDYGKQDCTAAIVAATSAPAPRTLALVAPAGVHASVARALGKGWIRNEKDRQRLDQIAKSESSMVGWGSSVVTYLRAAGPRWSSARPAVAYAERSGIRFSEPHSFVTQICMHGRRMFSCRV